MFLAGMRPVVQHHCQSRQTVRRLKNSWRLTQVEEEHTTPHLAARGELLADLAQLVKTEQDRLDCCKGRPTQFADTERRIALIASKADQRGLWLVPRQKRHVTI